MSKRKTQQQFIEQAKAKHGDRYDYSRVSYTNTKTPVEIICNRCGRHIMVVPCRHLRGDGCKYCSHAKTTEQFVESARKWHGDKYNYDKVDYTNNRTKVIVTCPKHGDFLVAPGGHLRGRGCPQCAIEYRNLCSSKNARKTPEQFAQEARCVHGDKYDYSKVVYKNNNTPVEIICPEHGSFFMRPSDHLHGCECPSCVHRKRLTTEEFIQRAAESHPDNNHYDYSEAEYVNYITPIKIKCTKCGNYFTATPRSFLSRGRGCPTCYGSHKLTQEEFVSRARTVHGDKYDYSESDYQGIDTKLKIICPKHGEFWQTPYQHINLKNGCPNCNSSKGELMVMRILENHNINFVHDKACLPCLGDLRPDFYLPDYNLVIEYDGIQHFQPSEGFGGEEAFRETQARDQLKNKLCEENGIKILHIPYTSEDVEKIILEAI